MTTATTNPADMAAMSRADTVWGLQEQYSIVIVAVVTTSGTAKAEKKTSVCEIRNSGHMTTKVP